MSADIREILCAGSDSMLDARMHPLIKRWDDPAKAIQILEVLDICIHGALASSFVIKALQAMYDTALKNEGMTHEEMAKLAVWRTQWT